MMTDRSDLLNAIYKAVDDLNAQLPPGRRLDKHEETPITGDDARLDSLSIVNLIVGVEQQVNQQGRRSVSLLEKFIDEESEPPGTLGELVTRILALQGGPDA